MLGDWLADMRHGTGSCKFADGTKFRGQWEEDGWTQSGADPARCKVIASPGLSRAVAGQQATFEIKVRPLYSNLYIVCCLPPLN